MKESKTDKLALDEKSQYLFPLVMCGPNNEWNDYDKTEYYDLSIPHCDNYTVSTSAARSTSDSGTQATVHQRSYLSLPVSVPVVSSAHLGYGRTCRIRHNLNAFQYSGQFGTFFVESALAQLEFFGMVMLKIILHLVGIIHFLLAYLVLILKMSQVSINYYGM